VVKTNTGMIATWQFLTFWSQHEFSLAPWKVHSLCRFLAF